MNPFSTAGPRVARSRIPLALFAAGLLLLLAALLAGISSAAEGGGVKIKGQPAVSAADIKAAQDVDQVDYTVRTDPGSKGTTKTFSGTSIEALVGLAGLQEGDFTYLTFPGPGKSTIYLSSKDVFRSNAFPDGPAFVTVKSGQVRFFRPLRGSSKQETTDEFLTAPGETLRAGSQAKGNVLGVSITSSDPTPAKGDTVKLRAKASGALPGETVQYFYRFSIGGGTQPVDGSADYEVESSRNVAVTVTASGNKGSGGQASTTLDVGKANTDPEEQDPTVGNGNATGGGTGTEGSATATPSVPGSSTDFPTGLGDYGNYGNYGDYGGYDPNFGTPPTDGSPSHSQNQAPSGPEDPTQSPSTLTPGLETISGTLVTDLSGAAGAPSRSDSAPAAASEPTAASIPAFNKESSESSLTLPLTGAGVVLLFLAGAGRELQESRRRPA